MKSTALYLRTIVFGVIDSLVSTVGLLAGIDVAGAPHATIALTGIVYAFVEGFSMAVGNYLSEESAEEYVAQASVGQRIPIVGGIIMFIVFVAVSFIPIFPYLIWNTDVALYTSVFVSVAALFVVGMVSAHLSKLSMTKRGLRMALLGGAAIIIGLTVGLLFPVA